jgi:hypothetical protein
MLHVKPSVPVQDVGRTRQRRSAQARNRLSERIAERRLLAPGARHTALLRRGDSGQHAAAGRLLLAALAERFDSHALLALAVLHWRRGESQSARAAYAAAAHLEMPLVRVPLVHLQHRQFDHHIVLARATSPGLRHALPGPRACRSSGVISKYAHTRIGCRRHARAQAASTSPP